MNSRTTTAAPSGIARGSGAISCAAAASALASDVRMQNPEIPLHILHVDDERLDQMLFSRHLARVRPSAHLTTIPDPVDALRELLRCTPPDLIVTDLAMPRISGIELIELVRQRFAAIPIVVLSSSARDEDILAAQAAGADGYAVKFPPLHHVAALLKQPRGKWTLWNRAPNSPGASEVNGPAT